jgi:hypothetical protein
VVQDIHQNADRVAQETDMAVGANQAQMTDDMQTTLRGVADRSADDVRLIRDLHERIRRSRLSPQTTPTKYPGSRGGFGGRGGRGGGQGRDGGGQQV